mmetsp:Transcript_6444/g.10176  ORF Transcript_6444/g.10176 Transcript_6444/m.10176 type:complete len:86 (+) Transcript_6444:517-774(+)
MTSKQPAAKKRKAEEKIDIANLQFGEDFDEAEAMSNAEIKMIIETVNAAQGIDMEDVSEIMQNSYAYCKEFGKFRDRDSVALCKT